MKKETIEIIARCKRWGDFEEGNTDERIANYLRKSRDTKYRFTYSDITKELRNAALDYIETCDNPREEFRRYLFCRDFMFDYEYKPEHEILILFLSQTQVMNEDGKFINGFYDLPVWHDEC